MTDIHRGSEVARLTRAITEAPAGLTIVSVSGAGGVGKSYLVHHVLDSISARGEDVVVLKVDGSDRQRVHDFVGLVEMLAPRQMAPPAKPKTDHFPSVRDVAEVHRQVLEEADRELEESGQPEEVRRAVTSVLRLGHALNQAIPKTKEYMDAAWLGVEKGRLHDGLDRAWDVARNLESLREKTRLPGLIRDGLGISRRNRVKRDLHGVMAEALVHDVRRLANPFHVKDLLPGRRDDAGAERKVLLWFDDYEAIGPTLGPFLISQLVSRLASERDQSTVLLIVGRGDLQDMDTSWDQHCERYMLADGAVRLEPFDRESALAYLAEAAIEGERAERIWESTRGFPFLLSLLVEEEDTEAGRASFLRRFYARTTKWMIPPRHEWFEHTCYLDEVSEDTLEVFFEPGLVGEIWSWFVDEPSICDPAGDHFQVRPLVRDKVLRFLELRSPKTHRERLERGKAAR